MSYTDDLNQAAHKLLDAEMRLRTIKIQLDSIDRDISQLTNLEAQLDENIHLLKRRKIVAMASEYKKAIEAKSQSQNRCSMLRIDRSTCLKSYNIAEKEHENARIKHEEALDRIQNPKYNVIQINFRRKDG